MVPGAAHALKSAASHGHAGLAVLQPLSAA